MLNEKISLSADENSEALTDPDQHATENRMLIVDQTQNGIQDTLVTWKKTKCSCVPARFQEKSNDL